MVATDVASRGIGMNNHLPSPLLLCILYLYFLPLTSCVSLLRSLLARWASLYARLVWLRSVLTLGNLGSVLQFAWTRSCLHLRSALAIERYGRLFLLTSSCITKVFHRTVDTCHPRTMDITDNVPSTKRVTLVDSHGQHMVPDTNNTRLGYANLSFKMFVISLTF